VNRRPLLSLVAVSLLVGCGSSDDDVSITSTVTSPAADNSSPASTDVAAPRFDATLGEPIDEWTEPVDIASRTSDGNTTNYLVERIGIVSLMNPDGSRGETALDISEFTVADGERGLLGLALSDDGSRAFVDYTDLDGNTNVDEYSVNDDGTFDVESRSRVYFLTQPYPNHNGGEIHWLDGSLWVFTGDGGAAGDPDRVALNLTSHLGKVIRLTETDGVWDDGEVVAVGLRNPWRVFPDRSNDELWITDVGQNEIEEINVVDMSNVEGSSFGWSYLESTQTFNADQADVHAGHPAVAPILDYRHTDGRCSISGGAVYRGADIDVTGTWFVYADWCTGEVMATCFDDSRSECGTVTLGVVPRAVGVLADSSGELWVLSQEGPVVPIVAD
jgi:glucose/arabinose dehydrogenase